MKNGDNEAFCTFLRKSNIHFPQDPAIPPPEAVLEKRIHPLMQKLAGECSWTHYSSELQTESSMNVHEPVNAQTVMVYPFSGILFSH